MGYNHRPVIQDSYHYHMIFCLFGNGLLAIIVTVTVMSQSLILVFVQLISVIVTLF